MFLPARRDSRTEGFFQLDDFDQDVILGNAARQSQENNVVNGDTNDQDFTVGTSGNNSANKENAMNVKTLERCTNERIDREVSNIVDTVEDKIKDPILTAIDNIVAPKIELAIRSTNSPSERDVTNVAAYSVCREHVGINASFRERI